MPRALTKEEEEEEASQYHFVHHKIHLKRSGIEPESPRLKNGD
jgi:hypothetical protein